MRISILMLSLLWLLPMQANARYTQISIDNSRFCGLLDTGEIECTASRNPEPLGFHDYPNTTFTTIEVAQSYTCGITTAGSVECWGTQTEGELDPPSFDNPVVNLSLATHHACAVDSGGVAKCWGQNEHGQATAPTSVNDFIDVDAFGWYHSCGVRSNGAVLCWGRSSELFLPVGMDNTGALPFIDIEYTPRYSTDIGCALRADGSADCWRQGTSILITQFRNGPYAKLFPMIEDQKYNACALTVAGEMDCVDQTGDVVRIPGIFQDASSSGQFLYGYTTEGRLVTITDNFNASRIEILDVVNGEIDMPVMVISGGEYYGELGTELFFSTINTNAFNFRTRFDTQILRDGEVIETTDNLGSYMDRTPVHGEDHVYTVRAVHQFGQIGESSNAVTISAFSNEPPTVDIPNVNRPFAPQNLRGEVYWYDVELFWDRDFSNTVRNYEIRRNGSLIGHSRGTSWYDDSSENGQAYQYDVLAIGHDDAILGINSVQVQIGPAECR